MTVVPARCRRRSTSAPGLWATTLSVRARDAAGNWRRLPAWCWSWMTRSSPTASESGNTTAMRRGDRRWRLRQCDGDMARQLPVWRRLSPGVQGFVTDNTPAVDELQRPLPVQPECGAQWSGGDHLRRPERRGTTIFDRVPPAESGQQPADPGDGPAPGRYDTHKLGQPGQCAAGHRHRLGVGDGYVVAAL